MKILLSFILLFYTMPVLSCNLDIVAFKGLESRFDTRAFNEYVKRHNGCARVFDWHETNRALNFINNNSRAYQLYGYSKGAESVRIVLEKSSRLPEYVITIGAWRTVDLDFRKYRIPFQNYFDTSGQGQSSPGIYLNVAHYQMQETVNNLLWKVN